MISIDCDVLIVGGGLVGASLACALDGAALRVVQVEEKGGQSAFPAVKSVPPTGREERHSDPLSSLDERHFALARKSVLALEAIGVWPHAREAASPIRAVEVSSRGDFGTVRIDAAGLGLDALGWTVPARALGTALASRVAGCARLERIVPARVVAIGHDDAAIAATIEQDGARRTLRARLIVAADGTESGLREMAGIGARRHDYGQTAIVAAAELARALEGQAYERFTDSGPVALLPLAGRRAGLVWTVARDAADETLALDDRAFLARLQERFGFRAGRFARVGRRQPWPLKLTVAEKLVAPRLVLVGNAAQTIHPLGAQGFNLGLRDVTTLAERLRGADDPGAPALLEGYAAARAADREATMDFSDGLTRLFARSDALSRGARSLGLAAIARTAPLKRELAFAMMGYRG